MSEKGLGRKEVKIERTGEWLDMNFITRHTIGSTFLSVYCTSRRVIKAEGRVTLTVPEVQYSMRNTQFKVLYCNYEIYK